jgi:hypothetical protein
VRAPSGPSPLHYGYLEIQSNIPKRLGLRVRVRVQSQSLELELMVGIRVEGF